MKHEIIIRNWLLSWLRPELETDYNQIPRDPITQSNYASFISQFKDDSFQDIFTDPEKETLKELIIKPIQFAEGYPRNTKETIQGNAIYIINGGWSQLNKYIGANYWHGKTASYIAIAGQTKGDDLNMAEPSLMLQVITSLLIAGQSYLTAHHMTDQVIQETEYATDERNAHENKFAMRTLTISYDAHRDGVITHEGQRQIPAAS